MANQGIGKMHLDLYTSNNPLTHKAKFWCNYVGALKGKAKNVCGLLTFLRLSTNQRESFLWAS